MDGRATEGSSKSVPRGKLGKLHDLEPSATFLSSFEPRRLGEARPSTCIFKILQKL